MSIQDGVAFGIVFVAAAITVRYGYRKVVRGPLANFLLKRGRVGLAMRVRGKKSAKDCACD